MSPKLFEYKGIVLRFYSEEHLPIHVHAFYTDLEVIVSFTLKNKKITKIDYKPKTKPFPPAQLSDLKKLIQAYKNEILEAWINVFIGNAKVKPRKITRL